MNEKKRTLIVLDRDGVLNDIVVDSEQGTIDSPLHPSQVRVFPWVPKALARLTEAGFTVAIATNQPSAAKRKTTQENLLAVHEEILKVAQSEGGQISSSHLCFHRSEDECQCRKPKTGLLKEAFHRNPGFLPSMSWMVGDGVTDIEAGKAMGMRTGFLAPRKCDACKWVKDHSLEPDFWFNNLLDFTNHLIRLI